MRKKEIGNIDDELIRNTKIEIIIILKILECAY